MRSPTLLWSKPLEFFLLLRGQSVAAHSFIQLADAVLIFLAALGASVEETARHSREAGLVSLARLSHPFAIWC